MLGVRWQEGAHIQSCFRFNDNKINFAVLSSDLAECMAVSYNKLWKLLIDKKLNKAQLCERAKISANAMAKLGKNEDVRVEVLAKICLELGCSIDDIMEILPENN